MIVDQEQLLQQVQSLRSEGKSIRAIAAELGVNRGRIDRGLRALARRQEQTHVPQADDSDPFVGRHREMAMLRSSLEQAISGRGQIAILAGDPGIGKTRTAQELASIANARNAEVFWGHCYEGEGAPPYWPWIQIIRSHIDQWDAERLKATMGSGAGAIGEIVPELRSKLPDLGSPPTFDPDSARFRLFDSITTYLKNASTSRPMVFIIEDLHWADASSLALLEHIAGNIAAPSLLIVGTYRDNEVSLDHPLSRTLTSLIRQEGFQSLRLGGLSQGEVGELVALSVGDDAPPDLAEKVHLRTEGNALFVGELLKLLAASGLDEAQEWQFAIPQGIRGVIGRRFDGLSDECNRALTVASVIGREFDFDLLARMTDSSDDDLLDVVDEAVSARVIEEAPGAIERYRFTHALIEQTLYERQNASRRARLHSRIGETLEDVYEDNLEGRASELVSHFSKSSRRQDSEKALRYGRMAANQAASVYAYREAVAYLEQCIDVQKALDPHDDEARCDLLVALGEWLIDAGEPQQAFEDIAPEAFTLAEARNDSSRAFRCCHIAIQGLTAFGALTGLSTPEFRQWAERADRHAEPETTDRIEADLAMAAPNYVSRDYPEAWRLLHRALRLARQLDDPEYIAWCNQSFLGWGWPPQYQNELFKIARESSESPAPDATPRLRGMLLASIIRNLRNSGDGDRAWRMYDQFLAFVELTKIPFLRTYALIWDIKIKISTSYLRFTEK
ncbi:MAG: AAA family ATPase [Chloroflexi bacterium]|nr:AAA family ATPase [Chloroflexota bacterium]